jgi:beta-lactamase class A
MKQNIFFYLTLILGIFAGLIISKINPTINGNASNGSFKIIYENQDNKYKFINPLLGFDILEPKELQQYKPLEDTLSNFLDTQENIGTLDTASVYFRALKSGRWVSVNENEPYSPASLLKVPTMIAFFKEAESDPSILTKHVVYNGTFDDNAEENIKPLKTLEVGASYTIDDLIFRMIAYSDNNALRLLSNNIDPALLSEVYTDIGISLPKPGSPILDFMNVKSYAYFFRILYNATYLSKMYSEKALQYLSEPDFPQGIQAGIPKDISLAQKFGERNIVDDFGNSTQKELHDCGIIYYPSHPYLLCVMTKGKDLNILSSIIQKVSSLVYSDVDSQYHK